MQASLARPVGWQKLHKPIDSQDFPLRFAALIEKFQRIPISFGMLPRLT